MGRSYASVLDEHLGTPVSIYRFDRRALGRTRYYADRRSAPDCRLFRANVGEAVFAASIPKCGGLFIGPAMAPVTSGPWFCPPLHGNNTTTRKEHSAYFSKRDVDVRPVVHGGDRPHDRGRTHWQGNRLSGTFDVAHLRARPGEEFRDPPHDRRRINPGDRRTRSGRVAGGGSGTTPDVNDTVARSHAAQAYGEPRVAIATEDHAERGNETRHPGKGWVVGMMIWRRVLFVHISTLTVEPDFKSSGHVSEPLLTIGEVAERAGVATSTIRYYERLNLLVADARMSGQRRYRLETLRRLVFIGMLQDAGLSLVDITGILDAADVGEWKAIATGRLEALDEQIVKLLQARAYLSGALLCRYDHPATDCKIMGAEINRRLSVGTKEK
jgi:MerR family transcriptional regulator, copper efflux regulator